MDAKALGQSILRRWADAIAARDMEGLAQMFAANAVFIATAPAPLQGRAQILAYYVAAPVGLTVQANLAVAALQTHGLNIVADVVFDVPKRGELRGRLSLGCTAAGQIGLYHLSLSPTPS